MRTPEHSREVRCLDFNDLSAHIAEVVRVEEGEVRWVGVVEDVDGGDVQGLASDEGREVFVRWAGRSVHLECEDCGGEFGDGGEGVPVWVPGADVVVCRHFGCGVLVGVLCRDGVQAWGQVFVGWEAVGAFVNYNVTGRW